MTNYYEALTNKRITLNREDSVATLRGKLIELESMWADRSAAQPEKAMEMLNLINQAKKVFADEAAKRAYDQKLFSAPNEEKPTESYGEEDPEFCRWRESAEEFFKSGQADLAKTALEQALQYQTSDDYVFLCLAARIYWSNGDHSTALTYINRAVVNAPEVPGLYYYKAWILIELYGDELGKNANRAAEYNRQARETIALASKMAEEQGDYALQAQTDGSWAYFLYFLEPKDVARAEVLARSAVKYNDQNAQRVLAEIEKTRAEQTRRDDAKHREEERRAAEMRKYRERVETEELEALERKQKKAKKRKKKLIVLGVLLALAAAVYFLLRYDLNSIGAGLHYTYDADFCELRISGNGKTRDYPYALFGRIDFLPPWGNRQGTLGDIYNTIAPRTLDRDNVEAVVIEEGVTYIGSEFFNGLYHLTSLCLPNTVSEIHDWQTTIDYIEYDGTIEEWIHLVAANGSMRSVGICDYEYVFSTYEASVVVADNGILQCKDESDGRYCYVSYDGTMAEMSALLDSLGAYESDENGDDVINCSDGQMIYANLLRGE